MGIQYIKSTIKALNIEVRDAKFNLPRVFNLQLIEFKAKIRLGLIGANFFIYTIFAVSLGNASGMRECGKCGLECQMRAFSPNHPHSRAVRREISRRRWRSSPFPHAHRISS